MREKQKFILRILLMMNAPSFLSLFFTYAQKKLLTFFCILLGFSLGSPLEATYILRYTTTDNGGITFTGNTLGLSKYLQENNPGTDDSIGAFITTDPTEPVGTLPHGPYPLGTNPPASTTLNYLENSSSAVLDLLPGSTILYAELVWGGSYGFPSSGTPPLPPLPNVAITLTTPQQISYTITADPATSQEAITPGYTQSGNYVRSADVTSIVQDAGPGTYIAGGIYGTIVTTDDTHNSAGWTLAVVYANPLMLTHNMTLFVGCEQASRTINPVEVSGFCAPPSGVLSGRLFISAIEGDANKTGDCLLFGKSLPLTIAANSLSGVNNPINNFFASQINTRLPLELDPIHNKYVAVGSSQLDERGSYGNLNADPFNNLNKSGGRQGYDITSIDVSHAITYNQKKAYALGTTTSDDYTVNALGLQIQVGAPIINSKKTVNAVQSISSSLGEKVTFSIRLENTGTSDALSVNFKDVLPTGLNYVAGSLKLNSLPISPDPDLTQGFFIGDMLVGQLNTIEFEAHIASYPSNGNIYYNKSLVDYQFATCAGNNFDLSAQSNEVSIYLPDPPVPTAAASLSKCKYLNRTEYPLEITWISPSPYVISYRVYHKGILTAQIPASAPLVYKKCCKSKKSAEGYAIVAVYAGNKESIPTKIRISHE
ncbi:hypothetical protein DB42_DW00110 [Neochlamydia sp. EPS4]|nr:hypothetical protein DB42_DW00110 [Neochlamydia sp. EPS4]